MSFNAGVIPLARRISKLRPTYSLTIHTARRYVSLQSPGLSLSTQTLSFGMARWQWYGTAPTFAFVQVPLQAGISQASSIFCHVTNRYHLVNRYPCHALDPCQWLFVQLWQVPLQGMRNRTSESPDGPRLERS